MAYDDVRTSFPRDFGGKENVFVALRPSNHWIIILRLAPGVVLYSAQVFSIAERRNYPRDSTERRSRREESLDVSRSLLLDMLMISWGVITVALVVLVVYRGTLSSREDDQIFIDAAEQHHHNEQQEIIGRISRLTKPIITLAVLSGVLLLASAGVWIYQGYKSF